MTVGIRDFDTTPVQESVELLRAGRVDYEFRTTVVREFHTAADIGAIGAWLEGSPRYFLQSFVDSGGLISEGLHGVSAEEMRALANVARPFFDAVELRGVD